MFSKPMKQNVINNVENNMDNEILNYKEYFKNNIILKKYKLPELKTIVRKYKLRITGNKDDLINRIEIYFNKMKSAEVIQKKFRCWLVKYSFILNGEVVNNRSLCVNDSDFVTLEPLEEIPRELFYSYKDKNDFYYGFNITSLIQMMKTKGKISNPYNRESFDKKTLNNMISLYNIIQIIYPEHKDNSKIKLTVCPINRNLENTLLSHNINPRAVLNNVNSQIDFSYHYMRNRYQEDSRDLLNTVINNNTNANHLSSRYYQPRVFNSQTLTNMTLRDNYNKIVEMRRKPMDTRIRELFMEIDQLGNYTQSTWFSGLQRQQYILLYRHLYEIWNYRAQLSNEMKTNICPLFEPFSEIFAQPLYQSTINENDIKLACLTIIENFVYSGIDEDHRKIGTLHALSALTMVSSYARNAMPWLYESVAF
jgi:hypothetical protein